MGTYARVFESILFVKWSRGAGAVAVPAEIEDVQLGQRLAVNVADRAFSMAGAPLSTEVMLRPSNTSARDLRRGDFERERERGRGRNGVFSMILEEKFSWLTARLYTLVCLEILSSL